MAEPVAPPAHIYTGSKIAQEHLVQSFGKTYGLPWTILRFDIPYGPGMRPITVFGAWARCVLQKRPITIYGTGEQGRCFVHVSDLAEGCTLALSPKASYQVFNLGGPAFVTVSELADVFCRMYGLEKLHDFPRSGDFMGVRTCSKKASEVLGWTPTTPLEHGISDYVTGSVQV